MIITVLVACVAVVAHLANPYGVWLSIWLLCFGISCAYNPDMEINTTTDEETIKTLINIWNHIYDIETAKGLSTKEATATTTTIMNQLIDNQK